MKNLHPLVSIVIPIYNGANYMREAIDSALAQTYDNIEVIVVNDGSTDETDKIAKSYGDKIRYFKKENGGVATALNLGIEKMKGEYFSWLSHDDVYYPNKIQDQLSFLSQVSSSNNVILFSDVDYINEKSEIMGKPRISAELMEEKPEYALLRSIINGITLLIPKSAFEEHGLFDEKLRCTQDYSKWFEMMRSYRFVFFSCVVGQYRWHSEQDTRKNPRVVSEGNELWIRILGEMIPERMIYLEGSEYEFYCEMIGYLQTTPYKEAEKYCQRMAMKKKDRSVILFVSHSSQIGGAELCLLEMVTSLHETNKYYCFVIVPTSGPLVEKLHLLGVHTFIKPMRWWVVGPDETKSYVKERVYFETSKIIPLIRCIAPTLICTNASVVNIGGLLARAMRIPHVWYIHELGEKPFEFKFYLSGHKRYVYIDKYSDYVLFNSDFTSKHYKQYSSFKHSNVITPGISEDALISKEDHIYYKRKNSFKLVVVGSILKGKRQKDAIDAVIRLKNKEVDVELVVAGEPSDEGYVREIEEIIKEHALQSNVSLIGFVQHPSSIIQQADVVLVCSENESFGRVTIEAMYMKKPVIGASSGGTKDIVKHNVTGLLYPLGDVEALTSSLVHCRQNPQICSKMGEKGWMRANKVYAESVFISSITDKFDNMVKYNKARFKFIAFMRFWIFLFYIKLKKDLPMFYMNNLKPYVPKTIFLIKNKILNSAKRLNEMRNMFFVVLKRDGLRRALSRSLDVTFSVYGPNIDADKIFAKNETLKKIVFQKNVKKGHLKRVDSVDIVVCVHNAPEDTVRCIDSIFEHTLKPYSIILIDDGSEEETKKILAHYASQNSKDITLHRNDSALGYTFAANQGLRLSKSKYVVLLNSDTIVTPCWLEKMVCCIESDENIGAVGPLSNTASWQSVPALSENGDWASNPIPQDISINEWSEAIAMRSSRRYPQVGFLNGFCIMLHRDAINTVGLFDEDIFGTGYGEENDYCIRLQQNNYRLLVCDDAYVYHNQSRSYSHERRKILSDRAQCELAKKYAQEDIDRLVLSCRENRVLMGVRSRVLTLQEYIKAQRIIKNSSIRNILFILPVSTPGGGANVILFEALAMLSLGINVKIANFMHNKENFLKYYPDWSENSIFFHESSELVKIGRKFDAVIASANFSVEWVKGLEDNCQLGYYVQDYEPLFYKEGTKERLVAEKSYTFVAGMKLFTKTKWVSDQVKMYHGKDTWNVGPSFDEQKFFPKIRESDLNKGRIRICAMIRPSSPRRGADITMKVLSIIQKKFQKKVEVVIFGIDRQDNGILKLTHNFKFQNLGILTPEETSILLAESDIFVDFSEFQAMGLTAMEAMASGCAVLVPESGGASAYASHEKNALIVDSKNEKMCIESLAYLVRHEKERHDIAANAIVDIARFSPVISAAKLLKGLIGD